jgi:hypothetical protein
MTTSSSSEFNLDELLIANQTWDGDRRRQFVWCGVCKFFHWSELPEDPIEEVEN